MIRNDHSIIKHGDIFWLKSFWMPVAFADVVAIDDLTCHSLNWVDAFVKPSSVYWWRNGEPQFARQYGYQTVHVEYRHTYTSMIFEVHDETIYIYFYIYIYIFLNIYIYFYIYYIFLYILYISKYIIYFYIYYIFLYIYTYISYIYIYIYISLYIIRNMFIYSLWIYTICGWYWATGPLLNAGQEHSCSILPHTGLQSKGRTCDTSVGCSSTRPMAISET